MGPLLLLANGSVIWVPDENLRALAPDEDYGSAQVLLSLEEWDPVQWGLKEFASPKDVVSST